MIRPTLPDASMNNYLLKIVIYYIVIGTGGNFPLHTQKNISPVWDRMRHAYRIFVPISIDKKIINRVGNTIFGDVPNGMIFDACYSTYWISPPALNNLYFF